MPDDLFTAIETVNPGEASVTRFWAPWTETAGFPLVTAKLDGMILKLTQKRFLRNGTDHSSPERYNIPITYALDSLDYTDTTPKFVFRIEDAAEKTFNLTKKVEKYFILNPQQTGFYRVNYEESNWNAIKEALHKDGHDNIHVLNRAQIVDDLFNLARGGVVTYNSSIEIIRYIKKERDYIPWLSAFNHGLTFLSQRVASGNDSEVFAWFIRDTVNDTYNHLKFVASQPTDKRTDIYNRVNILTWACKYGHEDCIKVSKEMFASFKTSNTKVHRDLRSIVYCNAIRHGTADEFNFLYDRFTTEDIAAEQLNILIGTACTKDVALVTVRKLISLAVSWVLMALEF